MRAQAAVLALITAAALTGCAGKSEPAKPATAEGPQTQTVEISYDELQNQKQISRSVSMSVGDTLKVSLGSNASTGFQWEDKMLISDPKVMIQTGHEVVPPTQNRPGAAGTETWTLEAKAPGTTTVSSTYGRPWPGGEKDSWVFTANVTVN